MTAAERFAWLNRFDAARRYLNVGNVCLVGGVLLLVVAVSGYRSGKAKGEAIGRAAVNAVIVQALADSSRVIEAREHRRYDSLSVARATSEAARVAFAPLRQAVRIISDTVVSVVRATDTLRVEVPKEIVREIQASDALHAADSLRIALTDAQLVDVSSDRDIWKHRALLDEETLKQVRAPRIGFKTGVVLGTLATLAVAHLAR